MNAAGQQNNVLIDSSIYSGSGQMDVFMFVDTSLFSGYDPNSLVYIYTSWGQYSFQGSGHTSGFDSSATPEDIAMQQQAFSSYAPVPEPSGILMIFAAGTCLVVGRRHRQTN